MPVVSDTSPLLGLSAIGHLELLKDQFGEVFIPQSVLAELKVETIQVNLNWFTFDYVMLSEAKHLCG